MHWITTTVLCVLFIVLGVLPHVTDGYTYTDEETLRTSLLTGYNNDVRPETPIDIYVSMTLMSLNYLDIGAQEMCANLVVISTWTDNRLVWTPSAHNDIQTLVVRYGTVWLPTIVIENSIDDAGLFGNNEQAPIRVQSNGLVTWISPAYVRVSCNIDVSYYPFDSQFCIISMYGWAQDITEMNMRFLSKPWFLSFFRENGEWSLDDTSAREYLAADDVNNFKSLYFGVTFRRKWQFPFLSIMIPGILNAVLMCAVFQLPIETVDRQSYSLTVLLSYYVLLTYVSDTLPPTSTNICLLQVYLTFVMMAGTLTTLLSVWVSAVHNYDEDLPISPSVAWFYHDVSTYLVCQKGTCRQLFTKLKNNNKKKKLCRECHSDKSDGDKNSVIRRRKQAALSSRNRVNQTALKSTTTSMIINENSMNNSLSTTTTTTTNSSSSNVTTSSALSSSSSLGVPSSSSSSSSSSKNNNSIHMVHSTSTSENTQRGTTVKMFDKRSRQTELPPVHDMSIVSADCDDVDSGVGGDGGVNSSTATIENETKAIPFPIPVSMTTCPKHGERVVVLKKRKEQQQNSSCDRNQFGQCSDCGKFLKAEEPNNVSEEEEQGKKEKKEKEREEEEGEMEELTWKLVAKRMDAVFFRVIGGGITLFTLMLIILLIAQY